MLLQLSKSMRSENNGECPFMVSWRQFAMRYRCIAPLTESIHQNPAREGYAIFSIKSLSLTPKLG